MNNDKSRHEINIDLLDFLLCIHLRTAATLALLSRVSNSTRDWRIYRAPRFYSLSDVAVRRGARLKGS